MPTETIQRITVPFEVKALLDEERSFEGYAATWDIDLGMDQIKRGAFRRTISHWKGAKRPVPMIDGHGGGWSGPRLDDIVGGFELLGEDDTGLRVKGSLLDDELGRRAYARVKGRLIDRMSIGYQATEFEFKEHPEQPGMQIRILKEIKLLEISLVFQPMNPNAVIDSVKSLLGDAERLDALLQAATPEQLKTLHQKAGALLQGEDDPGGLAPEDPRRIALEEQLRDLTLRRLATR